MTSDANDIAKNDEFISYVVKWVKLDDQARELTTAVKDIRNKKKELEDSILSMMSDTNQDVLNLSSGGSLRKSTSRCKSGLKEEYIRDVLAKFTRDYDEATIITEKLMKDRPVQERSYLKRCLPKKKTAS